MSTRKRPASPPSSTLEDRALKRAKTDFGDRDERVILLPLPRDLAPRTRWTDDFADHRLQYDSELRERLIEDGNKMTTCVHLASPDDSRSPLLPFLLLPELWLIVMDYLMVGLGAFDDIVERARQIAIITNYGDDRAVPNSQIEKLFQWFVAIHCPLPARIKVDLAFVVTVGYVDQFSPRCFHVTRRRNVPVYIVDIGMHDGQLSIMVRPTVDTHFHASVYPKSVKGSVSKPFPCTHTWPSTDPVRLLYDVAPQHEVEEEMVGDGGRRYDQDIDEDEELIAVGYFSQQWNDGVNRCNPKLFNEDLTEESDARQRSVNFGTCQTSPRNSDDARDLSQVLKPVTLITMVHLRLDEILGLS